uniref:Cytochrome P450 CYP4416D1 n=1 Tax=Chrysoperla zastrowi sillemi TaxID=482137 RepID=A0A9E7Y642_9NEOP|nr:cytochrome P450 CYP4416D1 [Chrysoperla zastrowi sillemi]
MILMIASSFTINYVLLVTLTVLIGLLTFVYFSNYFRICYFVLKIRGPRAYPIIGNGLLFRGSLEEMSKVVFETAIEYGPLTRLWMGPIPLLMTNEPRIIQEILTNANALEKAWLMKVMTRTMVGNAIIISEVPQWKRMRSIITRAFTTSILKPYSNIFVDKMDILIEILDKELNKENTFDISKILSKAALDSVYASSMGVNMNVQKGDSRFVDAMHRSCDLMIGRGLNPLKYPETIYRFTQDYKELMQCRDVVYSLTNKVISEKRNNYKNGINNNQKDLKAVNTNAFKKPLLDYLIDFTENNPDFTDEQLADEINFITLEAMDTTAKQLSWVLLIMAIHKDEQKKVYDELFEVLSNSNPDKIVFDDLSSLKYMEMVIKEAMRLFPVAPLIGRELTKDIHFENYTIPKGTNIAIPIFSVHRNEDYWENPLKFDPERFSSENIKKHHPYAFLAFSAGPRNCIGMRYAWLFMKIALACLLSRYEFHTSIKDMSDIRYQLELSLNVIGGHQVRITPRQK